MDPYKILSVDKSANDEQIKTAYRELSKKYHPDKNPVGKDMFEQITAAKELLLNKEKREIYNEEGNEPLREHEDNIARKDATVFRRNLQKCPTIHVQVPVKLSEIYNGSHKILRIPVTHVDDKGDVQTELKELPLPITHNHTYGKIVIAPGRGNTKTDFIDGDIHLEIVPEDDPNLTKFEIDKYNLIVNKTLTLAEAMTGFTLLIKHPNGQSILLKTTNCLVQAEQQVLYEGYGLPISSNDFTNSKKKTHGNLIIKTKFDFTSLQTLAPAEKKLIINTLNSINATKVYIPDVPKDAIHLTNGTIVINKGYTLPFNIPGLEGLDIPGLNSIDGPPQCNTQ